ncbi:hypothetical protein DM01DRAFT_1089626 [Hesseltinella vesiculosa]|uniref:Uncharacterized protein n=1 Tax=Hesseltinella vesiculosa TaxID=101127 RepID=A0A1X2GCP6_9FUNG|nr:hypothetical protein DM01DRAFT_1089626 [Hesseltinella vesiculosa]
MMKTWKFLSLWVWTLDTRCFLLQWIPIANASDSQILNFTIASGTCADDTHARTTPSNLASILSFSILPTKKTISVPRWMAYCRQLCLCLPSLTNFYGSAFTNNRFLAYVSKQKILDEAVNIFVSGGRKYKKSKARRGVDVDDDENDEGDEDGEDERPNIPLLMLGSGVFGFTRQGKKTRMSIIPKLKAAEKEGRLLVCVVNEAYTSQVIVARHGR